MNTTKITTAQAKTLATILAGGGLWENEMHMGRERPGMARKTVVRKLIGLGLVESKDVEDPTRQKYRGYGVTTSWRCFVTAAGRAALETFNNPSGVRAILKDQDTGAYTLLGIFPTREEAKAALAAEARRLFVG